MDSFKTSEIARMSLGGNAAFRAFWTSKNPGAVWKVPPTSEILLERYGGAVGEEWKERLSCKVEGREYLGVPKREKVESGKRGEESPARMPDGKEANEAFFARMGDGNQSRPEGLAPSQGGKYAGFGSAPARVEGNGGEEKGMPGVDAFQRDPVGALSQGFGWFASSVGKGARQVNEGWVRPTAQKVCYPILPSSTPPPLHPNMLPFAQQQANEG